MHYKSTPLYKRFILVYRLAMDAKTRKCDGVTGRKCPSLLEDFQTGKLACMNEHHYLTARA